MVSKKQRSKNAKAAASSTNNTTSTALGSKAKMPEKTSESPFLRLPREVRDKIYDELLINRLNKTEQAKYDQLMDVKEHVPEFEWENAMDSFDQEICLIPGGKIDGRYGYPFIVDAMGLLLANKQIHEEASTTLFSKNLFLILIEWERVYPFWRCERSGCYPPGMPCFVMFRDFKKIKHLYIQVNNTRSLKDPMITTESANLNKNLQTVVEALRQGCNKLKTLHLRYTSCFEGRIETVRESLEGKSPEGMPERPAMLKDMYGNYYCITRKEAPSKLFKYCHLLDPLRKLKGIADNVKVRGELPQALIDEFTNTLSVPVSDLGPVAEQYRDLSKAEMKRKEEIKRPGSRFHDFMKEMAEKYAGTKEEQFYRDCLKVPVKSPAVMEDLFKPPTQEELMRCSQMASQAYDDSDELEEISGDEDQEDVRSDVVELEGAIGMLDGKPVFGPVRPPGLL